MNFMSCPHVKDLDRFLVATTSLEQIHTFGLIHFLGDAFYIEADCISVSKDIFSLKNYLWNRLSLFNFDKIRNLI